MIELTKQLPLNILNVKKGEGSFLQFDLEAVSLPSCIYMLWVYLSDWIITLDNNQILNCEDIEENKYNKVLNLFINEKLLNIDKVNSQIVLKFSKNLEIILTANLDAYEKDDDLFMFYICKSQVISYSLEKGFYIEEQE